MGQKASKRLLAPSLVATVVGAAVSIALVFLFSGHSTASELPTGSWLRHPVCAMWDGQANKAMARRLTIQPDGAAIRQLGDAAFRIRRARRSCEFGLSGAACRDYLAVIRGIGGISSQWPGEDIDCPRAMADARLDTERQATKTEK